LDLPPDLTSPEYDATFTVNDGTSISAQATSVGRGIAVLPESVDMKFKGQGTNRYLEVALPAEALWKKIQGFWSSTGIKLKRNEPQIGIVETDWIEKRNGLPKGTIQKLLSSVFKNLNDTGTRDRYTLRLERVGNKTNLFMTHRGAEYVVGDFGNSWEMRPASPEKAAEMLNRLHTYLQTHAKKTKAIVATKPTQPSINRPVVKPKVTAAAVSIPLPVSKTIAPLSIKPTLNEGVVLSTVGTLGANVVNVPAKTVRRPVQKIQSRQVKAPVVNNSRTIEKPAPAKSIAAKQVAMQLAFLSTTNDGQPALGVRRDYKKVFEQTEAVLKKAGFVIDGKNAKNGLYAIQYKGGKGSKKVVKKGSKQILHIIKLGKVSAMRLLDINGKPLSAKKAKKILGSLESAFNR
jgi:uncharacterized lipoprotein